MRRQRILCLSSLAHIITNSIQSDNFDTWIQLKGSFFDYLQHRTDVFYLMIDALNNEKNAFFYFQSLDQVSHKKI